MPHEKEYTGKMGKRHTDEKKRQMGHGEMGEQQMRMNSTDPALRVEEKRRKRTVKKAAQPHRRHYGLHNQGSTCYLNSVLQVLFKTPELHDRLDHKSPTDHVLKTIFEELKKRTCETRSITKAFGIRNVDLQYDARDCLELILNKISPQASEVIQGKLTYTTKCCEGHSIIEETNPFWTLPLSLKDAHDTTYSVQSSLDRIFELKSFRGDNMVYCNECKEETEATTACEMVKSQILSLLLKRFDLDYNTMPYFKSDCCVDVPQTLQIKDTEYKLYGMVNHMSSLRGGHYTATTLCSEDDTWYEFHDHHVSKVEQQPFATTSTYNSRTVYLLMYRANSEDALPNQYETSEVNDSKQDNGGVKRSEGEKYTDNARKRKTRQNEGDDLQTTTHEASGHQAGGERAAQPHRRHYGLHNQGSTCYLNSVLQVLFKTPELHDRLNHQSQTDHVLKTIFEELKKRTCETRSITKALGIKNVDLQYDARDCLELILNKISPQASEVIQGKLTYTTKCCEGHSIIEETNPFWTLPLSLKDAHDTTYSVQSSLDRIFELKSFRGDNMVYCNELYCSKCKEKTEATTECEMVKSPQILSLLLKRFDFDYNTMSYFKDCSVDVPQTLQIKDKEYKLYGMVNHAGSLRGGHYTATTLCSEDDTWYEFHDHHVSKVEQQPFATTTTYNSRTAYLLMYRVNSEDALPNQNETSEVNDSKQDNGGVKRIEEEKHTDNARKRKTRQNEGDDLQTTTHEASGHQAGGERAAQPHRRHYGLHNQGSTCYLNSVLQVLFKTPELHDRLNHQSQTDHVLKTIFEKLKKRTCETRSITKAFGIRNVYEQRDAPECLELILNKISPQASEVIQGKLTYTTKCCEGHSIIEETNPFWTLPLSLKDAHDTTYSVQSSLDRIFELKSFSGENMVYCNECKEETDATTACDMVKSPQILSLLLKRFDLDYNTMSYFKSDCCVDVPQTLQIKDKEYKLYGMVNRMSSLTGRYYTATTLCSEDDTWYEFHDDHVSKVEEWRFPATSTYNSRTVYLLMYRANSEDALPNQNETSEVNDSKQENGGVKRSEGEKHTDNARKRKTAQNEGDDLQTTTHEASGHQDGGETDAAPASLKKRICELPSKVLKFFKLKKSGVTDDAAEQDKTATECQSSSETKSEDVTDKEKEQQGEESLEEQKEDRVEDTRKGLKTLSVQPGQGGEEIVKSDKSVKRKSGEEHGTGSESINSGVKEAKITNHASDEWRQTTVDDAPVNVGQEQTYFYDQHLDEETVKQKQAGLKTLSVQPGQGGAEIVKTDKLFGRQSGEEYGTPSRWNTPVNAGQERTYFCDQHQDEETEKQKQAGLKTLSVQPGRGGAEIVKTDKLFRREGGEKYGTPSTWNTHFNVGQERTYMSERYQDEETEKQKEAGLKTLSVQPGRGGAEIVKTDKLFRRESGEKYGTPSTWNTHFNVGQERTYMSERYQDEETEKQKQAGLKTLGVQPGRGGAEIVKTDKLFGRESGEKYGTPSRWNSHFNVGQERTYMSERYQDEETVKQKQAGLKTLSVQTGRGGEEIVKSDKLFRRESGEKYGTPSTWNTHFNVGQEQTYFSEQHQDEETVKQKQAGLKTLGVQPGRGGAEIVKSDKLFGRESGEKYGTPSRWNTHFNVGQERTYMSDQHQDEETEKQKQAGLKTLSVQPGRGGAEIVKTDKLFRREGGEEYGTPSRWNTHLNVGQERTYMSERYLDEETVKQKQAGLKTLCVQPGRGGEEIVKNDKLFRREGGEEYGTPSRWNTHFNVGQERTYMSERYQDEETVKQKQAATERQKSYDTNSGDLTDEVD